MNSTTALPGSATDCLDLAREGEKLCKSGRHMDGIVKLQRALEVGSDNLHTVSAIYSQLGNAFFTLKDYNSAIQYYVYGVMLARVMGSVEEETRACSNLGNGFKLLGQFDEAHSFTYRQLDLARKINNEVYESTALYHLGSFHLMKAKKTLKMAKGPNTSICDPLLMAEAEGDLTKAIEFFEQFLEYSEKRGDRPACGRAFGNIANIHYLRKEYEIAIQFHMHRLEIAKEFGDKGSMRRAYSMLGNSHLFLKQLDRSIEYYRLALSIAHETKDKVSEAQMCYSLANAASLKGDHLTAADYHCRHLLIAREVKDRIGEGKAYLALSADFRSIGDFPKALYFLWRGRKLAREVKNSAQIEQMETLMKEVIAQGKEAVMIRDRDRELFIDSTSDPDAPLNPIRLSLSLRSLVDDEDCGISRRSAFESDGDLNSNKKRMTNGQEDFFDLVSRLQSKRIDEQRFDISVLSDMTNSKPPRQSDTLSALNVSAVSSLSSESKKSRRLSLSSIGRVTSKALREIRSSATLKSQRSSEVFRVPELPPPPSAKQVAPPSDRRHSICISPIKEAKVEEEKPKQDSPDALIDQLMQAQGRRMEEQRAHLFPGLHGGPDLFHKLSRASEVDGLQEQEFDEHLLELVARAQSQRMNEQRSELGGRKSKEDDSADTEKTCTLPDDEALDELVLRMQAGRLEEQRAHLAPPSSPPAVSE